MSSRVYLGQNRRSWTSLGRHASKITKATGATRRYSAPRLFAGDTHMDRYRAVPNNRICRRW
jgi:hypothetical protein